MGNLFCCGCGCAKVPLDETESSPLTQNDRKHRGPRDGGRGRLEDSAHLGGGRSAPNTDTVHSTDNVGTGPGHLAPAPPGGSNGYLEVASTSQDRAAAAESQDQLDPTPASCRLTRKELSITDSADGDLPTGPPAEAEHEGVPGKAHLRDAEPRERTSRLAPRRASTHELATVTLRHIEREAAQQLDEDGNEITLNRRELGGHRATWEYLTSIKKRGTISFTIKSRVDGEKKVGASDDAHVLG